MKEFKRVEVPLNPDGQTYNSSGAGPAYKGYWRSSRPKKTAHGGCAPRPSFRTPVSTIGKASRGIARRRTIRSSRCRLNLLVSKRIASDTCVSSCTKRRSRTRTPDGSNVTTLVRNPP